MSVSWREVCGILGKAADHRRGTEGVSVENPERRGALWEGASPELAGGGGWGMGTAGQKCGWGE